MCIHTMKKNTPFIFLYFLFTVVRLVVSNIQIVKEYERAVIFRLGRITDRKAKGPGLWLNIQQTLWLSHPRNQKEK